MTVYYNENDPQSAAWLRELIAEGLIAHGDVDERSITDVKPHDLRGYTQCHFFAGIGVWSYALRNAGWPDATPVWTGSCPCQSFSASGKRGGFSDKRHLWPVWFRLIEECKPHTVFGEQVASKDGLAWFDVVSADLEGAGYAVGAADICAAGLGAPHIRQRLYFVADCDKQGRPWWNTTEGAGANLLPGDLGNTESGGRGERGDEAQQGNGRHADGPKLTNGFWADAVWLYCRDNKWRPTFRSTQSIFQLEPDGLADYMGAHWDQVIAQIKEEINRYADHSKTNPGEVLRALWNTIAEASLQRQAGGQCGIPEPELLLIALCELAGRAESELILATSHLHAIQEGTLRILRQSQELARPSSQWGLDGSPTGELTNIMCELSPLASQHEEPQMPALRCEIQEAWNVSEALSAVAKIWRSFLDQDTNLSRVRTGKNIVLATEGFPLADKIPGRVGLLRGAGNALCAPVAQAFIEAYLEVRKIVP